MIIGGVFLSLTLQVWTVWPALDLTGWLAVAFIVIIGTALSFTAFVTGISEIGPMKATLLGTLEPVVASVTSAIALGTTFHTVELIGYAASSLRSSSSSCRRNQLFRNTYFSCIIRDE